MKNILLKNLKNTLLSTATILALSTSVNADCSYELFSISANKGTSISSFVEQLSGECEFSVIVTDPEAEKHLDSLMNKTNLKNLTINEVLDLILKENNLTYTLESDILKISYVNTKTYNIDYIITARKSIANTDVTLSSKSGSSGGAMEGASTDQASSGQAESGIKIEATDEVIFWEELDLELQRVLNRPEDIYQAEAPIINKNAGMVTVSATIKQHERLDEYLKQLQTKVSLQVLIDVHMLSVSFQDGSTTGVDWSQLYAMQNFAVSSAMIYKSSATAAAPEPDGEGVTVALAGQATLKEVVKFLKTQGDVRAISNPKILTLNNQPALVSVGTELFYKIKQASQQQGAGGGVVATVESDQINSVFAGVLLDITPEISENGTITLKVNPSISQTIDAVSTADRAVQRDIPPDLDRRQLSSVVTVSDGNRVILGGLISTRNSITTNKVPLLGDIPGLGYFFKYEKKLKEVQELIIVIEPHIIDPSASNISLAELGYTGITNKDVDLPARVLANDSVDFSNVNKAIKDSEEDEK